jgi:hypothetical protein
LIKPGNVIGEGQMKYETSIYVRMNLQCCDNNMKYFEGRVERIEEVVILLEASINVK